MITREQIEEIIKKIVSSYKLERIILFGSYAYGNPTANSDLDLLVVVKSSNLPRYKRAREIRKHLWGVTDFPKDILVYTEEEIEEWKEVEEAFITRAIKEGRILYDKNKRGTDTELA
ncbi:MAG: nucleotidyltransferase domain-containing protein [Euryarchaeota archaeon]|nr:nucleotidyltransferase domain-containing protein [Euryarchaeota archaeon]